MEKDKKSRKKQAIIAAAAAGAATTALAYYFQTDDGKEKLREMQIQGGRAAREIRKHFPLPHLPVNRVEVAKQLDAFSHRGERLLFPDTLNFWSSPQLGETVKEQAIMTKLGIDGHGRPVSVLPGIRIPKGIELKVVGSVTVGEWASKEWARERDQREQITYGFFRFTDDLYYSHLETDAHTIPRHMDKHVLGKFAYCILSRHIFLPYPSSPPNRIYPYDEIYVNFPLTPLPKTQTVFPPPGSRR